MKAILRSVLVLLLLAGASAAQGQQIYSPSIDLGASGWSSLRLIETKTGDRLGGATLDFCFTENADYSHGTLILGDFDRVVVPLKIDGNALTGSAVSSEGKRAVEVRLARRQLAGQVSYAGTVSVGGRAFRVDDTPVTGGDGGDDDNVFLALEENPKHFGELSPNALAVKIKRDGLAALVQALRGANVTIDLSAGSLDQCAVLRSGFRHVKLLTAPEESQALVARLRKLPYVAAAGWSSAATGPATVRVTGRNWLDKGALNRAEVARALSAAVAKHLGAEATASSWEPKTGQLKIELRRPSQLFPGLGLTDQLNFVALVAAENFGGADRALIWMEGISGAVVDIGPGPRVGIGTLALFAGPVEGISLHIEPAVLAGLLKAEWWDGESGTWRQ